MSTINILGIVRMIRDTRGQDMIEYALIAAFLATFACAALPNVADGLDATAQKVSGALTCAATSVCPVNQVTP